MRKRDFRQNNPNADTSALEKQIDEMVRAGRDLPLQDLTPEEITLVEGKG